MRGGALLAVQTAIGVYLAATLTVAGVSKALFVSSARKAQPPSTVRLRWMWATSLRFLGLLEVLVAMAVLIQGGEQATRHMVVAMFVSFALYRSVLLATRSGAPCCCYHPDDARAVEVTDLLASWVMVSAAIVFATIGAHGFRVWEPVGAVAVTLLAVWSGAVILNLRRRRSSSRVGVPAVRNRFAVALYGARD